MLSLNLAGVDSFIIDILILIVTLVILNKASGWAIGNVVKVAEISGYGKTTVGFLLIGLSTSLPELSVAFFSIGDPEAVGISIGNVLGSNIVNVCLILGVCILYATMKHKKCIEFLPILSGDDMKDLQFGLFMASIIPLILIYIGYASRVVGVGLLLFFVWNTYQLTRRRTVVEEPGQGSEKARLPRYLALTFVGLVGVVASSYFIVESATSIALGLGLSKLVIGATVVAIGTSLPELATSLVATKNEELNIALGNIIGSGIVNLTLILGATLALTEFTVNISVYTELVVFSLIGNLFLWYSLNGDRICEREGYVLVALYVIFLFVTLSGFRSTIV
jgi:cation:H+ antiporter